MGHRLHLLVAPDQWPDGGPCRRAGCTEPAVRPHGYCVACEALHIGAMHQRARDLKDAARAAHRRAPELYDELPADDRDRLLTHLAAHTLERGGRLGAGGLRAALGDFWAETIEAAKGANRRREQL